MTESSNPLTFADPETRSCPFPAYNVLREEHPVYMDPETGNYVLTRFEDVRHAVLQDADLSNRTKIIHVRENPETDKMYEEHGWLPVETLVNNDPPEHSFYRALVDKVFTRQHVMDFEPRIQEIVDGLIAEISGKDEVDFIDAFASNLPLTVIAEQLGVPNTDIDKFRLWTNVQIELVGQVTSPERELEITSHIIDMQNYFAKVVEVVRESPDASIISRLANVDVDGRQLTTGEIMGILQQLLVAGNDTTTATLGSAMKILVEQPEITESLRRDPSLIDNFVDETLRAKAPVQVLFRRATKELIMHGVTIPEGAIVEVRFGAANHDKRQFENPELIDLHRPNARTHLAFGAGRHFCIGRLLALAEARIAFKTLVTNFCNFRFSRAEDSFNYTTSYISHGVDNLWISFDSIKEEEHV